MNRIGSKRCPLGLVGYLVIGSLKHLQQWVCRMVLLRCWMGLVYSRHMFGRFDLAALL